MIKNFRTIYGIMPFGYVGDWGQFWKEANKKEREEILKALKRLHQLAGLTWTDIYEPQLRIDSFEVYCSYGWGQSLEAEKMPVSWYEIYQVMNSQDEGDLIFKIVENRLRNFFDLNRRLIAFIELDKESQSPPRYLEIRRHLLGLNKNL